MSPNPNPPFCEWEDSKACTDPTSSEPSRQFCDAKTGVFWDVQDYPILDLFDPDLVKHKITETVHGAGYTRDVSILVWVDKNKVADHLLQIYSAAKIPITFLPKDGKLEMVHNMMVGILLWALDNPGPANVMVLSKYIGNEMRECLEILCLKGYSVLLSNPPEESNIFPCNSLVWLLKSLSPAGVSED